MINKSIISKQEDILVGTESKGDKLSHPDHNPGNVRNHEQWILRLMGYGGKSKSISIDRL